MFTALWPTGSSPIKNDWFLSKGWCSHRSPKYIYFFKKSKLAIYLRNTDLCICNNKLYEPIANVHYWVTWHELYSHYQLHNARSVSYLKVIQLQATVILTSDQNWKMFILKYNSEPMPIREEGKKNTSSSWQITFMKTGQVDGKNARTTCLQARLTWIMYSRASTASPQSRYFQQSSLKMISHKETQLEFRFIFGLLLFSPKSPKTLTAKCEKRRNGEKKNTAHTS